MSAGMTIENIGGMVRDGSIDRISTQGQTIERPLGPEADQATPGDKGFTDLLKESIDKANDIQLQADRAAKELAAGRNKNIHETMLLMEKADMSLRLVMQVRNKIIEAYREIMRMQV